MLPVPQFTKGGGGQSSAAGFSSFPNILAARIQLLFDWDDGFKRVWKDAD